MIPLPSLREGGPAFGWTGRVINSDMLQYQIDNTVPVRPNLIVIRPDNSPPFSSEPLVAPPIVFLTTRLEVGRPVYLDNETLRPTFEVGDVRTDRLLSAELGA